MWKIGGFFEGRVWGIGGEGEGLLGLGGFFCVFISFLDFLALVVCSFYLCNCKMSFFISFFIFYFVFLFLFLKLIGRMNSYIYNKIRNYQELMINYWLIIF